MTEPRSRSNTNRASPVEGRGGIERGSADLREMQPFEAVGGKVRLRSCPLKVGLEKKRGFSDLAHSTGWIGGWSRMPVRAPVTEPEGPLSGDPKGKHRMPSSCLFGDETTHR
jgi:hypothetical protein